MNRQTNRITYALSMRTIWLYTTAGLLVVIAGMLVASYKPYTGFLWSNMIEAHKLLPVLFVLDSLPFLLFLILWFARKQMVKTIMQFHDQLDTTNSMLNQYEAFARTLSEGDDPDSSQEMLETSLGQALKLIQLNIKSNRKKEREVTWITEGKEMISRLLRLHNDIDELAYQILKTLSKYLDAIQGAMYLYDEESDEIRNISLLAYNRRKYINQVFNIGEGLVGQCAFEMDYIYRTEIPDDYISISSGILGEQKPKSILLIPLITNGSLQGVMEFAFLEPRIQKLTIQFNLELGEIIARTFYNLRVNEKTRFLLEESRTMTAELQQNEQILQENAEVMKSTQDQLQKMNFQLQHKIEEEKLAQDRLHWLLENASEIIAVYDENYHLKYISPSVEHILGYSREEMMNGKDFERIDQNGSNEIRKAFDLLQARPDSKASIEYTFIRKDGTRIFLLSNIRNLLNHPSIKGFIFNTRDITETRLIEKEQRLKFRMQSLSENSLDLIMRLSSTGIVHYVNPVVEDYSGVPASRMLNKPLEEIPFNNVIADILQNSIHRANHKPEKFSITASIPILMGGKEGERILNFNVIPEFQESELETILFVGHDITEAKRIEREIKLTNRKMQDSINYAERIQSSILPSTKNIIKSLPKGFLYYQPRDVISGDIPWFYESKDFYYIAVIDCTGHGVPGALLSFIAFFLLNNICALNPGMNAGEIGDELDRQVKHTLKQDQKNTETRDGMDMALCKIKKDFSSLEFVGAHRPLFLLREGELTIFKGDRKAVGGLMNPKKPEKKFEYSNISVRKGDKIFIFSDGITDQLGGPIGLKYSTARLRDLLVEHPGYTINQFEDYIKQDFSKWLYGHQQIDDILLIGIEF